MFLQTVGPKLTKTQNNANANMLTRTPSVPPSLRRPPAGEPAAGHRPAGRGGPPHGGPGAGRREPQELCGEGEGQGQEARRMPLHRLGPGGKRLACCTGFKPTVAVAKWSLAELRRYY